MATALYRRYRPESFAEVIGQDHVTTPLRRALRAGRVGHAYLFSGPRGCGKTTSARILARCLNCTEGPTDTPCGTCDSCRDLARAGAGSLDVVEIDAASHGGVDDARELRERASFAPVRDRFKVFIIDEAHMVTSAGFNALLKLVEEPPDHVKFVFATTEPDKVIGTIRSRTHHYPFRLIPPQVLGPYLEEVCVAEQVQVGEGVMPLVVRAGAGSARDSMSVLDQLMAGSDEGGLDFATAIALLGFTDTTLLDSAITAIAQRDAAALYGAVEHVLATGHEPRRFVEDLLERMRDLIVLAAVPDKGADLLPQVPADELGRMRSQATLFSPADLSLCGDLVHETLSTMSGATSPRLHLELLAARLVLRNERAALAAGEAGAPAQGTAPAGPVGQQSAAAQSAPGASGAREEARRIAQEKVEAARQARGGRPQAPAESRERPGAAQEQPAPAPTQPVDTRPAPQETPAPAAGTPTAPAQQAPVAQAPQDSAPQREQDEDRSSQAQAPSDAPTAPAQEPSAPAAPQREQAAPAGGGLDADQVRGHWSAILDELQQIRRPSWALVSQNAHVNGAHGGTLVIGFRTEGLVNAFHRGTAGENLADAVRRIMHTDVSIEAVVGEDPGPGGGGAGGGGPAAPGGSGPGGPTGAVGPVRPQASSPGAGTDRAGAGQPAPAPWGDSAPSMPPRGSAPGSAQPPAQSSAQPAPTQPAAREEPVASLGQRASERAMQAAARAAQAGRSGGSTAERVEDFAPEPDDPYPPDPRDTYPPADYGAPQSSAQPSRAPQAPAQDQGRGSASGPAPASTGRWPDALNQAGGERSAPAAAAPTGEIPVVEDEGRDSVPADEPRTYGQNALKRAIAEGRVIHSRPAQNVAAPAPADTGDGGAVGASLHAMPPAVQSPAPSAASANAPSYENPAAPSRDAPDGSASARAAASWGTAGSISDSGPSAPAPSAPAPSATAPSAPARSGAALVREAAQASRTAGQRTRGARGTMPDEPEADADPTGGATRDDADAIGANRNGREVIEKILGGKVLEVIDENRPR
ncbi:MAG: DNA polymerase III subunit gamma and tau [Brachybacterium sp.]